MDNKADKMVCLHLASYLQRREVMVDQKGEATHGNHQKLNSESIMVSIIGCPELRVDQVDRGIGACNVDKLFGGNRNV